jgi:hypothetical protein
MLAQENPMLKIFALATILSVTACATDDVDVDTDDPIERTDTAMPAHRDGKTQGLPEICTRLPLDGPCALACDPEHLVDRYVPAGTCALFSCTPEGGEPFSTGGCNE